MNNKVYFKDGKFSVEEYSRQMKFLSAWNGMSRIQKKAHAKKYADYSKAYNLTQGIPTKILKKLCCLWFYDSDGKRRQLNYDDIVKDAVERGEIVPVNHGSKFREKTDGTYEKKCWWCRKYLFSDPKRQYGMMKHGCYSDISRFPHDEDELSLKNLAYLLVKDVIFKFYKKIETVDEKQTVNQTPKADEVKNSDSESRGRRLVKYVEGKVEKFNKNNVRRRELDELGKMSDHAVERLCDITARGYADARRNNSPKWSRSSEIDVAIRTSLPDVSDDLRAVFSQLMPAIWDVESNARKRQ